MCTGLKARGEWRDGFSFPFREGGRAQRGRKGKVMRSGLGTLYPSDPLTTFERHLPLKGRKSSSLVLRM